MQRRALSEARRWPLLRGGASPATTAPGRTGCASSGTCRQQLLDDS